MRLVQPDEKLRLSVLRGYNILGTEPEEEFDRITRLAATVCRTSAAVITLIDEDKQFIKSKYGIDFQDTPRALSFCQYTIQGNDLMEIPDALLDTRFRNNPFVVQDPCIRFYAGQPLIAPQGVTLGSLAVVDTKSFSLDDMQRETLRLLAEEVVQKIVNRRVQEEEAQIRSIFTLANDMICIIDKKGNIQKVNPAFNNLLGWTDQEMIGRSINDFIHPEEDFFNSLKHVNPPFSDKPGVNTHVDRVLKKDGTFINVEWVTVKEEGTDVYYCVGRNIDVQMQQELKLKQVNEFLEQTGFVSHIGGWEVNMLSETIKWHKQARAVYEVDDDFDPTFEQAMAFFKEEEDRALVTEAVQRSGETGKKAEVEARIVTAKGRERWVHLIILTEYSEGNIVRFYGTIQNIDAKKRQEIKNRQTSDLLDSVLRSASKVCIISTDEKGIIKVFNSGAENLTGYSAKEMVGKHSPMILHKHEEMEMLRLRQEKKHGIALKGFDALIHEAQANGSFKRELTFVRKDGTEFIGSLILTAVRDIDTKMVGILGITTDITEQHQIEKQVRVERARLRAFIEDAPVAIAMFDNDLKYIANSRKSRLMYNLSEDDITGKKFSDIMPHLASLTVHCVKQALSGKAARFELENYQFPGADGDRYVKWIFRPWLNEDETVGGIILLTEDVTEGITQQNQLKEAQQIAQEASRAKSDFLAGMSHEIRTPLNGIIGFTDLLLKTDLSDTQRKYLEIVNQSGSSLITIVNDILDFSKIEAHKLELEAAEFDIFDLIHQAANIISYQAQNKGLSLLLQIPPDLPRFIVGDAGRIRQVIINLLSNAVKFTHEGEVELKLRLDKIDDSKASICFLVRDTGIGIQPERQSAIFSAFTQEDTSISRKFGGTGLGLSISSSLLALMHSAMKLDSKPGAGSTFSFTLELPYRRDDELATLSINRITNALVATPDMFVGSSTRELLTSRNIVVREVRNGLEALSAIAAGERYDLIVLDSDMPYLDGEETCVKIRESLPKTEQPIISLLHKEGSDVEHQVHKAFTDADLQFVKPLQPNKFLRDLNTCINSRQKNADPGKNTATPGIDTELKIMIVEDNVVNMLLSTTIVKRALPLATIIQAKNGVQAVDLEQKHSPDLILMDIQMPEMNGYVATRLIRTRNTRTPIIALTASATIEDQDRCQEAGMNDFLMKPFVEKALFEKLYKWITKS